ncbi:MAG: tRNA (5-methylaminomethyl-2-thiouridine)(34)-methyltransferase MnmD [Pseudomonadota bacterium]
MQHQRARVSWRPGEVPVSDRFDDPYYSLENGVDETRHTFLSGNDLPARFCDGFQVAELGFGTGLNFLTTLMAWPGAGQLRYTGFEAFPMAADDMVRALAVFPALPYRDALVACWRAGRFPVEIGPAWLDLRFGDARTCLPGWEQTADAWYLDGFAPARNPELWEPGLMAEVARHTAPGGTLATYTAAGHVRRSLEAAGFTVSRQPGYGRKRHMTVGRLP